MRICKFAATAAPVNLLHISTRVNVFLSFLGVINDLKNVVEFVFISISLSFAKPHIFHIDKMTCCPISCPLSCLRSHHKICFHIFTTFRPKAINFFCGNCIWSMNNKLQLVTSASITSSFSNTCFFRSLRLQNHLIVLFLAPFWSGALGVAASPVRYAKF